MQAIPIISCYKCAPETWEITGKSKFGKIYICSVCRKLTDKILKRKEISDD